MRSIQLGVRDLAAVHRNQTGAYDSNPLCPHCRRRAQPERGPAWIHYGVGDKGGSDLIGCTLAGRFVALEVKTPTGRATPEQLRFIEAVRRNGGVGAVVRSVEEAVQVLTEAK